MAFFDGNASAGFQPGKRLSEGAWRLGGSVAAAHVITLLASPVLTRLYQPSDLGLLQLWGSMLAVTTAIGQGRYDVAVLSADNEVEATQLAFVAIAASLATGIVVAVAMNAIEIPVFLRHELVLPYLWFLPIAHSAAGIAITLQSWALREQMFATIVHARILQATSAVFTQIATFLITPGPFGLLLGDSLGKATSAATLARRLTSRQSAIGGMTRLWTAAVKHRAYPLVSTWSSLVNTLGFAIVPFLMLALYDTNSVGQFALADRTFAVPAALVATALSQSYTAEASNLLRSKSTELRSLYTLLARRMALGSLAPCIVLAVAGDIIFAAAFGEEWSTAGKIASRMAIGQYVAFCFWPMMITLTLLGHHRAQLAWDALRIVVVLVTFWWAAVARPDILQFMTVFSVATGATYGLHGVLCWHALTELLQTRDS